jgi:1,4-dihydroxy-2-naphthoate octaprenyltransferase
MRSTPALDARTGLEKLATYPFQIASWVEESGYPISVVVSATIDAAGLTATFVPPAGLAVPVDRDVSLTGSHIRPQPGYGYDERRHVTVWGRVSPGIRPDTMGPTVTLVGRSAWGWDEAEVPFFEYSERSVPRSRRYFDALSAERGTPVKPRLSFGFLVLRTTRLPFLTATIVPVLLGIAIAASHGFFDLAAAALTVIGAAFVQLGLNVANDVFDTAQGADDANVTPTQFSGGSRVIQYGLVSLRRMATLATVFYVAAAAVGLVLMATHGSPALLVIGVVGFVVSLGYTAPPLKLVYRGLGEVAVALGFGPLMLLGAYVVQTGGTLAWEPFVASIPIALLVALILYVNEIPDRRGDAHVGKRTLPVRWPRATVVTGYNVAATAAYVVVAAGVLVGLLPVPALLMLLTIPLARRVSSGLLPNYDDPYRLMAFMGVNVRLHLARACCCSSRT